MRGLLEYKSITAEVKDVDVSKRIVTGYFSNFGNKDFDGDIIVKGAFEKSIRERGPQSTNEIFYLNQHNWSQPLGRPYLLQEDEKGLYFESEVTETSYGKDALILYAEKLVEQHSIGFVTIKSDRKDDVRYITEAYLYEGSCVTLGANDKTPFTGFKSLKTIEETEAYVAKITKLLKRGSLTDETFIQLEIALKQLQREAYILGQNNPLEVKQPEQQDSTDKNDKPDTFKEALLKSLKNSN